jgi:hypothetical protein
MFRRVSALAAFLLAFPILGRAQVDTIWVNGVSGESTDENSSREQALQRARDAAYGEALRRQGIQINAVQFSVQSEASGSANLQRKANDAFVSVIRTGSQGFVVDRRNERWETENIETRSGRPPILRYRLTVDVKLGKQRGSRDPDFSAPVKLNQSRFASGDKVRLEIVPTHDCHVMVFNIAGDSVRQLFPNVMTPDDRVAAGKSCVFPPRGVSWIATLPEGWDQSEELIMVVATKGERRFNAGKLVEAGAGYVSSRQAGLRELMEWLASVPLDQLTESVERMEIVGK